jgi:hypothetical protein
VIFYYRVANLAGPVVTFEYRVLHNREVNVYCHVVNVYCLVVNIYSQVVNVYCQVVLGSSLVLHISILLLPGSALELPGGRVVLPLAKVYYRAGEMWKNTDIRNTTYFDSSLFKAGLHGGLDDTRGGPILKKVLKVIAIKKPAMLVLENVLGLLQSHKAILDMVMARLQCLGYTAQVWQMNAKDNGIPQNRERLFIVGVHNSNSHSRIRIQAPAPLKPTKLSSLLNPMTPTEKKKVKFSIHGITEGTRVKQILKDRMSTIKKAGFDWQEKCFCIDVDGSAGTMMYETSPCITRARGAKGHWLSPRRH